MQQQAIELLELHNIRPSVQRVAVLEYLLENRIHPTVDEIYLALSPTMPTLSKTTVYNVLKNLVENNVILALNIDDKNVRYDACMDDHSHLKCEICNKVYDIPQPKFYDAVLDDFKINKMHIYCWGICPNCDKM